MADEKTRKATVTIAGNKVKLYGNAYLIQQFVEELKPKQPYRQVNEALRTKVWAN